jgi:hypothetical protein
MGAKMDDLYSRAMLSVIRSVLVEKKLVTENDFDLRMVLEFKELIKDLDDGSE